MPWLPHALPKLLCVVSEPFPDRVGVDVIHACALHARGPEWLQPSDHPVSTRTETQ